MLSKKRERTGLCESGTTDIIVGRRPVADWDGLVRDYFAGGGEQIRTEFMNAIQR